MPDVNTCDYAIVGLGFPSITELLSLLVQSKMIQDEDFATVSDESLDAESERCIWPEQRLIVLDFDNVKNAKNYKKMATMVSAARYGKKKVVLFGKDAKTVGYCRVEARYCVIHKSHVTILNTDCHLCLDEQDHTFYPLY
jgi:hypothetical protein